MRILGLWLSLFSVIGFGSVFPESWNVTQTTNGMIVSAGQMLGTNDGSDPAVAGNVGEIKGPIQRLRSNAISLTSNSVVNVGTTTSITLGPGVYSVHPRVGFGGANLTTLSELSVAVSNTSATLPPTDTMSVPDSNGQIWMKFGFNGLMLGATDYCMDVSSYVVAVPAGQTKTLYLVARGVFTLSTLTVWGSLFAKRIR